jgi:hypothetical protein
MRHLSQLCTFLLINHSEQHYPTALSVILLCSGYWQVASFYISQFATISIPVPLVYLSQQLTGDTDVRDALVSSSISFHQSCSCLHLAEHGEKSLVVHPTKVVLEAIKLYVIDQGRAKIILDLVYHIASCTLDCL